MEIHVQQWSYGGCCRGIIQSNQRLQVSLLIIFLLLFSFLVIVALLKFILILLRYLSLAHNYASFMLTNMTVASKYHNLIISHFNFSSFLPQLLHHTIRIVLTEVGMGQS